MCIIILYKKFVVKQIIFSQSNQLSIKRIIDQIYLEVHFTHQKLIVSPFYAINWIIKIIDIFQSKDSYAFICVLTIKEIWRFNARPYMNANSYNTKD